MRMAADRMLTVLAVASWAAMGCSDKETTGNGDATTNPTQAEVTGGDATNVTSNDTSVGTTNDSSNPTNTETTINTETSACGSHECGLWGGINCGTCTGGKECSPSGKCELPGAPMGAFCGQSAECKSGGPTYPNCLDDQCDSKLCLSNSNSALLIRDVCSKSCQIYKDTDKNGVNDADATQNDCAPADIVNGPAGDAFRCVNYAPPGSSVVGLCTPGTEFVECGADSDCPATESCDLTSIAGDYVYRCVARYRENATWPGKVVGMADDCNDDPSAGELSYCGTGLCFGLGCVPACKVHDDCDTTTAATECDMTAKTCKGKPSVACTSNAECSGWECGAERQILGDGQGGLAGPYFKLCWPKGCDVDDECGAGFYCRFFWNGEDGDAAALDNSCLRQNPEGVELGEKCTSDPELPGNVCKNEDLCVGGFCSALCGDDSDCSAAAGQKCVVAELPGDTDDDGTYEFVLPLKWCDTFPSASGECLSTTECPTGKVCNLYELENPDAAKKADGKYILAGTCVAYDAVAFTGTKGDFGQTCTSGLDCKSTFCLGATDTQPGICAKVCNATSECGTVSIQGEVNNGLCLSLLYGWAGTLLNPADDLRVGLCLPTTDTLADCASNFTCTTPKEVCNPNIISASPELAAKVEYYCAALVDAQTAMPTKALGAACDATKDVPECASGLCWPTNAAGTTGYCSALCKDNAACTAAGTTCVDTVWRPRAGAYAENSGVVGLCRKDAECEPCSGVYDCPENLACVNLGAGAGADYRCVPSCTDTASCAAETGKACNDGADEFGRATKGCFDKNGAAPVNYCAQ